MRYLARPKQPMPVPSYSTLPRSTYINSTGIALIVGLLARARKSNRRLVVIGLSDHYVEIFHITRLVDFMSIYPDETSVLAQVG